MGYDIAGIGEAATGGAIGTVMGLALEGHNDRRQLKQQQKLQEMQMQGSKEMAEFNRMQQMKMWEDTNYGAQMAQLKKAGLNPGLIYGMGGGGGATVNAAQAQGPSGGEAPRGGGEAMGLMQSTMATGAQTALIQAQKDLIEAQTKTEAVKPANIEATTGNIKADTKLKNIDAEVKGRTIEDAIDIITGEAGIATYEAIRQGRKNGIEQATVDSTLTQIQAEAIGALIRNAADQAGIKLTEAQTGKVAADIAQGWKSLDQKDTQIIIDRWVEEMKANNVPLGQVLGKLFNNGLEEIRNATKPKYKGYTIPKK